MDISDKLFYLFLIYLSDSSDEFCLTREINSIIIVFNHPPGDLVSQGPRVPSGPGFFILEAMKKIVILIDGFNEGHSRTG